MMATLLEMFTQGFPPIQSCDWFFFGADVTQRIHQHHRSIQNSNSLKLKPACIRQALTHVLLNVCTGITSLAVLFKRDNKQIYS